MQNHSRRVARGVLILVVVSSILLLMLLVSTLWRDLAYERTRTPIAGTSALFSPNGKLIATSSPNASVRVWNLSGTLLPSSVSIPMGRKKRYSWLPGPDHIDIVEQPRFDSPVR